MLPDEVGQHRQYGPGPRPADGDQDVKAACRGYAL